jgi:uncharacterized membrane-anchored protein YhcB (DUF1043 family)
LLLLSPPPPPQAESEAALAALREETVGLREALDAQRAQLERHYAGLHAKMRKEYEQVGTLTAATGCDLAPP